MHAGSVPLRGLLAASLLLSVLAGGACVLGVGARDEAAVARAAEADMRRAAVLIADRLSEGLAAVGREAALAGENVALARDGNVAAVRPFLERWRALHPGYLDVLVADGAGRVLATASGTSVGADVSGTTWFARGLAGIVIGDATDRARADADAPRNVIVGAPVRAGGPAEVGVLAVRLAPDWIAETIAATRRGLGGGARDAVVRVTGAGGRTLHRSAGLAPAGAAATVPGSRPSGDGAVREASAAAGEGTGLGWLVSVSGRDRPDEAAGTGAAALLALAAAALAAACAGGALGGRLGRDVARIRDAARADRAEPADGAATADLARLAEAVAACVGRSQGRERLLKESRAALARSRDRVRAVRLLGGFTCWEVDLRNGQVTWADGSAEAAESASERACALAEVLRRVEPVDRDGLTRAIRAACEEPGSIREVVVRTLAAPGQAVGRRLLLRLTAVALDGHPVRLHVLSRELALALPAPAGMASAAPAEARPAAPEAEPRERQAVLPTLAIVAGLAQDVGGALDAAAAALEGAGSEAAGGEDRVATALREAARGRALLRRVAALLRPDEASEADTAGILAETAAFVRAALLPGLVLAPPEDGLPGLACGARAVEVALLNVASDARASLPAEAVLSLAVGRADPPGDALPGVRVVLRAPPGFRAGRGLAALEALMDGIGGSARVAADGGETLVTLVFPGASATPGEAARAVLLVEPDAVLRAATAQILTDRGYAVAAAATVEEAGAILAARRDVATLLCAHVPPALDGALLARVVARTHPSIDVVLTTAEACRPPGSAAFRILHKPFDSQGLVRALEGGAARRAAA